MMSSAMLRNRLRLWTLILSLVLGVFAGVQSSTAQGTDEEYDVTIFTPHPTSRRQAQEIVVRVRTLQGAPAHGIPVRFQLDPEWQGDARIVPAETTTEQGIARARVNADLIGYVGMTVHVGFNSVTKRTGLTFDLGGHSETGTD